MEDSAFADPTQQPVIMNKAKLWLCLAWRVLYQSSGYPCPCGSSGFIFTFFFLVLLFVFKCLIPRLSSLLLLILSAALFRLLFSE